MLLYLFGAEGECFLFLFLVFLVVSLILICRGADSLAQRGNDIAAGNDSVLLADIAVLEAAGGLNDGILSLGKLFSVGIEIVGLTACLEANAYDLYLCGSFPCYRLGSRVCRFIYVLVYYIFFHITSTALQIGACALFGD